MKRLKDLLALLNALIGAWPILVSALLLLVSLIIGLSNAGKETIPLFVPLPLLLAAAALMLYPAMKSVQWLARTPMKPFIFAGLLWKPSKLSFRYPIPLCPREGCGCEIIFKADPSVNIEPLSGQFLQARNSFRFTYECPMHGVISGVPDAQIAELQTKAKMVQNRRRAANTDRNEKT